MKLYTIPQGSRIKAETRDQKGKKVGDYVVFHKIDGAYSYCTVEGKPEEICHLSANQELTLHKDGYYTLGSPEPINK